MARAMLVGHDGGRPTTPRQERATATAAGTVALLSLIAVLAVIGAAVYLGSEQVLSIVAGRVTLTQSDPGAHPPAPESAP